MKERYRLFAFLLMMTAINVQIFANSSWYLYANEPYTVLPYVIIFTLLFEIIFILYFIRIRNIKQIFYGTIVIIIANTFSFLLTLVLFGLTEPNIPKEIGNEYIEKIIFSLHHWQYFINGFGFLGLTLIIEIPIIYNMLKNNVENKRRLIIILLLANTITTVIISIYGGIRFNETW
jgi:hypothetical protein